MGRPEAFDAVTATPSDVVAEVWAHLQAEEYDRAAELHTGDFAAFAQEMARRDAEPIQRVPRTADDLLALNPEMPRAVAEWEAEQYAKQPAPPGFFGSVSGVDSLAQLDALAPVDILARRLQAADWRTRLRPHLRALIEKYPRYADQLERQIAEARSQWGGSVLGHVESSSRAYVVIEQRDRSTSISPSDWPPNVVVLQRAEDGWRVSSDLTAGQGLVHFHIQVEGEDGELVTLS